MNNLRSIFLALIGLVMLNSCNTASNSAGISGKIEGAEGLSVYIDEYMYDSPIITKHKIDIDSKGEFNESFEEPWKDGIYRVRVGRSSMLIPLNSGDKNIRLEGNIDEIPNYKIGLTGSKDAETLVSWMDKMYSNEWSAKDLNEKLNDNNAPLVEMIAALEGTRKSKDPLVKNIYNEANNQMIKDAPDSKYTKQMKRKLAELDGLMRSRAAKGRVAKGATPPPIEQKDPNGKMISLEDLKGKVVLLDFWASWCRPCRRANPMVVELYKKYNKQGFEVFNISLDKSGPKWKKAIKDDNLIWPYHVSDLKGWSSIHAKDYSVTSIPKTFLLDREGKIAEINVRDKRLLEEKIKGLL